MTTDQVQRRLAAVLAADVAGYSRLMAADEEGTLTRLKALRKATVDPAIASFKGRIVKTTGDGMLVEFASAVDATRCSLEVQRAVACTNELEPQDKKIEFRIGIHVGDIIIDEGDIFGDGVNIAARLEAIADPGGICLSNDAYRQIRGKVGVDADDLGLQLLKNIPEPQQVWRFRLASQSSTSGQSGQHRIAPRALVLPDKPSIAVLPFRNMSGDAEQAYFADGMVEEIITALSRFNGLFVIARNSTSTYKGSDVDVKQIGEELGVRYVLRGSLRKDGCKIRIHAQLIDSVTGTNLWADRFEGQAEDAFFLQDEISAKVVGELMTEVRRSEIERANRKPTASLDAYDYYLRGTEKLLEWAKVSNDLAQTYFLKAVELDDNFAAAYGLAGHTYIRRKQSRWTEDAASETAEAIRLSRRAIELGRVDELALCVGGFNLAYIAGELDLADDCMKRGLSMNANFAWGWSFSGWVQVYLGEHELALEHLNKAERLSPRDPNILQIKLAQSFAHYFAGHYEQAARLAELITGQLPTFVPAWRMTAVSFSLGGDLRRAQDAAKKSLVLDPAGRVSVLESQLPLRRIQDRERWKAGLLRAGFPE